MTPNVPMNERKMPAEVQNASCEHQREDDQEQAHETVLCPQVQPAFEVLGLILPDAYVDTGQVQATLLHQSGHLVQRQPVGAQGSPGQLNGDLVIANAFQLDER